MRAWRRALRTHKSNGPWRPSLNNHNHKKAGAGLSRNEVRSDRLIHWKPAALIAAEADRRRGPLLQKSDKRDLHCRPICANNRTELHNADQAAGAGETW